MFTVPKFPAPAACARRDILPLVDEAFRHPGGDAAQQMRATVCPRCPIAKDCLDWAMRHAEYGVWGGSSPHARTRNGAPRLSQAQGAR